MAQTVILLIRTLLGLLIGGAGLFSLSVSVYILAERNAAGFGANGLIFLVPVLIGGLLLIGSWRMLKSMQQFSRLQH